MTVHLLAGRWQEAERLAAELLDDNETRAGAAYANYPMVILHVLRGQPEDAREERGSDAAERLDEATTTLTSLGAAPALARSQELSRSLGHYLLARSH